MIPIRYASALAFALLLFPPAASAQPAASPADRLSTETLASQVTIRRDGWGVPHVLGENVAAVMFGFGFAQAEDRVLSITRKILAATGRMAERFGENYIEADFYVRRYGIADPAALAGVSPQVREILRAFAAGFNLYVAGHRKDLPVWVEPIDAAGALAMNRNELLRFAFNRGRAIERLRRQVDAGRAGERLPSRAGANLDTMGSNMWALAPDRTAAGHAILMGNPHQSWDDAFYEAHLTVPGELNIYGAAFTGGVVPVLAFNGRLGWSHTVNGPDLEDIYELALDPDREDHYLFDGQSVAMEEREVTVRVKTGDGERVETRRFQRTALGPVIHRTAGKAWVIRSAALDELGFIEQWLRMGQASNLAEFDAALELNALPMFNVAYADADGNILYHWLARLPRRPEGRDASRSAPANGAADVWQTVHPIGDLPRLLNPPGGYVQNSNDPPWFTVLPQALHRADFPPTLAPERLGLRSQHSLALIDNRRTFTLEEIVELKYSPRMLLAERLRDDLVGALNSAQGDAEPLAEAAALLAGWDGLVTRESRGPVLFERWWRVYRSAAAPPWRVPWSAQDPAETPRGLGDPEAAVAAMREAIDATVRLHGAIDVEWGAVHRARRGDLDLPIAGGSGANGHFRVITYEQQADGARVATGGDGWVFAVEFSDPPRAFSILAYGQSERADSLHHADQLALFAEGRMKAVSFTEDQIGAALAASYRPGGR